MLSIAVSCAPLGLICLQISRIPVLNGTFANLAGLLLSPVIPELLVLLVALIWIVALPFLRPGKVPPSIARVRVPEDQK